MHSRKRNTPRKSGIASAEYRCQLCKVMKPVSAFRLFAAALLAVCAAAQLHAQVRISEFLADNVSGIQDENGTRQDWIELSNSGSTAVSVDGWWLTDKVTNPAQWRLPAVSIPARGTLLVWASGKDRYHPARQLHTNFSLSKSGEYLGLYRPDPTTGAPTLVHDFGDRFPATPPDVSYGDSVSSSTVTLVATGRSARYRVLGNNATGSTQYSGSNYGAGEIGTQLAGGWNVNPAFDDATWVACTTGLGYDTGGGLNTWIATNCQSALYNINTSLCFRTVFQITDPVTFAGCKLRMKYEDGFVAWINGTEVARANFSGTPAYNSRAAASLNETIVNSWTEFDVPVSALRAGANVLAIQGLNSSVTSSDFLLLPEITAATGSATGPLVYFSTPTPGSTNGAGSAGPLLYDAAPDDPLVPRPLGTAASPPLKVTVRVLKTRSDIANVRAFARVMYNAETAVTLNDAGVAPDDLAGDGVYSGHIATNGITAGQMLRWRFEAQDTGGTITKLPAFTSATDSPQYFGTVALTPAASTSELPIIDWFVEGSPANGPTAAAFRGACYLNNRFYDNIGHEIHGQSTAGLVKKSYDFDSNDGFRFVWKEGERPVKDLNLLSNYADKTKTRNTLAHEIGRLAGTPYHFAFPVRMHLNGAFHGVMDMVEDGDDRLLERNGLDPEGAFYKIYAENPASGPEKKTRKTEANTDLNNFAAGLDPVLDLSTRRSFAYDQLNLPATVNYLAVRQFNHDRDHGHKNYYLFCDTNRTREWRPIIWDVDLSWGHQWNGTEGYFDDDLIYNNPLNSHSGNNRVYNLIYESPEMREMFVRRMRTLMDTLLQAPGTTNGLLETRLRQIVATVDPDPAFSSWTDGDLDAQRWGIDSRFSQNRPREEVERVITGYLAPRRSFLFDRSATRPVIVKPGLTADSSNSTAIPDAAPANTAGMVAIDAIDFLPGSNNQDHEYIILRNKTTRSVDLSGWRLEGAVDHVIEAGTVVPAGLGTAAAEYRGLLHIVKDAYAFRQRTQGPKGGEKRLVQGNYQGQLSARGETITLRDAAGLWIADLTYNGTPTPLQQSLRISEIQYHPAEPTPAELAAMPWLDDGDFEYLELVNTGTTDIPLGGAWFADGIEFTFPTLMLAAGSRVIVAKDPAAFALRHPGIATPVLGPFAGDLANPGEHLELRDAAGENVVDFTYKDGWYPVTDGSGRSLVAKDPAATAHDGFGDPLAWAISAAPNGSPGAADTSFAQSYHGWDNRHFTALERDNPLIAGPAADPDGDGRNNAEEYALATDPRRPDRPMLVFEWAETSGTRRPALRFRRPTGTLDVTYELLADPDPAGSTVVATTAAEIFPSDPATESVRLTDPAADPAAASSRFLKLRVTVGP